MRTFITKMGIAFMGGCIFSLVAGNSVWAELSQNELRILALEEKLEALTKKGSKSDSSSAKESGDGYIKVKYKGPGFEFLTKDGLFSTKLVWRAQMRYTNPNRSDPRSIGNFSTREEVSDFELRRVRMKIGGHGYKPWIQYYFEVDLQPSKSASAGNLGDRARVIDWRITVQPWDWLGFRVGQWKINFNRERVDSSGRQTFVERSIVNRQFTIDRQVGAMLQGRLFKETHADMRYYAGVFNGEGRATNNDDGAHMWMGRLQWNFLGRDLKWRQSDVKFHKKPTASLAFASAYNEGRCTRWSSSGCGTLDSAAFPMATGDIDRYRIDQYVQEFAFKYKGLAIQQEYHWKNIKDRGIPTQAKINMQGAYAQIGYFFHYLIPQIPRGVELAFRYAFVDEPKAGAAVFTNTRKEYTFAVNYFIAGHNNKVTVDYSHLTLDDALVAGNFEDDRIRVQWDISF